MNPKTIVVMLSLAVLLLAGGTVAAIKIPWTRVAPSSAVGLLMGVRALQPHFGLIEPVAAEPAVADPVAAEPIEAPEPVEVVEVANADTSLTLPPGAVAAPVEEPVVAEAPAKKPPPEPVDYSRLNHDVRVVAKTLDRFNQKLLLLIAQARAQKQVSESQGATTDGTPVVDEGGAAPAQ